MLAPSSANRAGALQWPVKCCPVRQVIAPRPKSPPTPKANFRTVGMTMTHSALFRRSLGIPSGISIISLNTWPHAAIRFCSRLSLAANAGLANRILISTAQNFLVMRFSTIRRKKYQQRRLSCDSEARYCHQPARAWFLVAGVEAGAQARRGKDRLCFASQGAAFLCGQVVFRVLVAGGLRFPSTNRECLSHDACNSDRRGHHRRHGACLAPSRGHCPEQIRGCQWKGRDQRGRRRNTSTISSFLLKRWASRA